MAPSTLGRVARALTAPALALGATAGLASAPASAAVWSSCDQWASTTLNGYTLYNDIWGSGAGAQCIWANSGTNWGVNANHPNTGGIKSYPNAKKVINKSISSLSSLSSSYNVTVPSSGAYETAYDIWDTNYKYEIMLWVNKTGAVGPLGTSQGTVTLGGSTWTVYKGNNGSNDVFSFVRSSNSGSGTVNILPILKWIKDTKGWFGDVTIGDLQFGFEITSSAGGLDFTVNSESVSSS
ncbi:MULTISPECIES: glycoside hydrolase family 12 protein [unclassified Streptomyces]|uniref:glycoside hydrolase family 12 protein n=1 Tax=unclassified Streptomyces TaxID=2593676 RepID=UPI0040424152